LSSLPLLKIAETNKNRRWGSVKKNRRWGREDSEKE
jgi:hypothetical protein